MNGNAVNGVGANASSPNSIDATCNWWGGIAGTVAPLMSGDAVTFELFLVNGSDNDGGTPGFPTCSAKVVAAVQVGMKFKIQHLMNSSVQSKKQ